ncbi:hypothetical protein C8039_11990 [Halogeometricum sp. wsp3]|nr:hypothetical protein C8039_11990 [Halogeometricum sp. wsp3]
MRSIRGDSTTGCNALGTGVAHLFVEHPSDGADAVFVYRERTKSVRPNRYQSENSQADRRI